MPSGLTNKKAATEIPRCAQNDGQISKSKSRFPSGMTNKVEHAKTKYMGLSTAFGAKAPNCAQDDSFWVGLRTTLLG